MLPFQRRTFGRKKVSVSLQKPAVIRPVQDPEAGGGDLRAAQDAVRLRVMGPFIGHTAAGLQRIGVRGGADDSVLPAVKIQSAHQDPLPAVLRIKDRQIIAAAARSQGKRLVAQPHGIVIGDAEHADPEILPDIRNFPALLRVGRGENERKEKPCGNLGSVRLLQGAVRPCHSSFRNGKAFREDQSFLPLKPKRQDPVFLCPGFQPGRACVHQPSVRAFRAGTGLQNVFFSGFQFPEAVFCVNPACHSSFSSFRSALRLFLLSSVIL